MAVLPVLAAHCRRGTARGSLAKQRTVRAERGRISRAEPEAAGNCTPKLDQVGRARMRTGEPGPRARTASRSCGQGRRGRQPRARLTVSESVLRCWKVSAPSTKPDSTPSVLSPSIPPAQDLPPLPRRVTGGPRGGAWGGAGACARRARVLEGARVPSSPGRTTLGSSWLRYLHAGKILFMGSLRQLMVVRIRIAWQYFNITDMSHLGFLTVLYYTVLHLLKLRRPIISWGGVFFRLFQLCCILLSMRMCF